MKVTDRKSFYAVLEAARRAGAQGIAITEDGDVVDQCGIVIARNCTHPVYAEWLNDWNGCTTDQNPAVAPFMPCRVTAAVVLGYIGVLIAVFWMIFS